MDNKLPTKKYLLRYGLMILGVILLIIGTAFIGATFNNNAPLASKKPLQTYEFKPIPAITLTPADNEEIGSLSFTKLGISVPLVYGYNDEYMDQYFDVIGLESWGNFPGQQNKIYINGHRHLAFQNLKYLTVDDTITITMPYGVFTYKVSAQPQVVLANDPAAVDFYFNDRDTEFSPQILRLQTCYPFEAGSTLDHRYLVDLVLIESNYI